MQTRREPATAPIAKIAWPDPRPPARARVDPITVNLVVLGIEAPQRLAAWADLPRLLDHCFQAGLPCLVLTPAPREVLAAGLERLDCATRLPMRICAGETPEPLPHPDAVRLAASRLAIPVRHVLLLTDGPHAAVAGAAAGTLVVGLGTASAQGALRRTGATYGVTACDDLLPLEAWVGTH